MTFLETLEHAPCILTDGATETRIAFETSIPLDPDLEVYGQRQGERIFEQLLGYELPELLP